MLINKIFYILKPIIPRNLQITLRRMLILHKRSLHVNEWPVDKKANKPPQGWSGWPKQKQFALVLTHDVESAEGQKKCFDLMKLEQDLGFRSSFNFVPERFECSPEIRYHLIKNGFEIGVHGLNHDGKLYKTKEIFQKRVARINNYLKEWEAVGFRSPAMHHNLDWLHELNIEYDTSTFDTDPFEPQSDGTGTIFPIWISGNHNQRGYVELPYTLPQDFLLFILMKEKNFDIWKNKLNWLAENGGMVLLDTHPDYMNFKGGKLGVEEYPAEYYQRFLEYIKIKYEGQYWHVLPMEIAQFWSKNFLRKN